MFIFYQKTILNNQKMIKNLQGEIIASFSIKRWEFERVKIVID
jgi:hypothetical protein